MISQPTQTLPEAIKLVATHDLGETRYCKLKSDEGIFIGASSNCGFQLGGEGLSEIHCRISFENSKLWVQDWMSASGTRVNGELLAAEREVQLGDVIQIGQHRIAVEASSAAANTANNTDSHTDTMTSASEAGGSEEQVLEASSDQPVTSHATDEISTDESVKDEISTDESATDESATDDNATLDFAADFFNYEEEETYDRETVALLHAEIEDLQAALAQRDADQTYDRSDQRYHGSHSKSVVEEPDTLLERMQELIDEANRSDERVAILEEMLHSAEVANQSEQEERGQLEAWVGQIESRIGQREEEHLAEVESLRQRLDESNLQQERLQRQLQQAALAGGAPKQYEETLENLQASNKQLRENLATAEKQSKTLERKLTQVTADQEVTLQKERANIAQEQAKLSRLRFDVSSKLADIEQLPKQENPTDKEAATRINALRAHLREIHEQEKQEVSEVKDTSLTARLSKLWNRVQ